MTTAIESFSAVAPDQASAPPTATTVATEPSATITSLATLCNGCKDDPDGLQAKISLVTACGENLFDTLCWLHALKAITINKTEMLGVITWTKPGRLLLPPVEDAGRSGMFVCSALEKCGTHEEMANVVSNFLQAHPQVDVIETLRYINGRGFIRVETAALIAPTVTDWRKRPPAGKLAWERIWRSCIPDGAEGDLPYGAPTYVDVHNERGRKASIAFLGTVDETLGPMGGLKTPADILIGHYKLPPPSVCISVDAGSQHPRQCDSIDMMSNLPQFYEWVKSQTGGGDKDEEDAAQNGGGGGDGSPAPPQTPDGRGSGSGGSGGGGGGNGGGGNGGAASPWSTVRANVPAIIDLQELTQKSIQQWQEELPALTTDKVMQDGSINNLIFMKLKEVFSALLDAAKLAGAWIVVDRTNGQGSATADLLLEFALERGAQRPTIVVIDSLERLGNAREGGCKRAHKMVRQLCGMFFNGEAASPAPNGTEKELLIDWMYSAVEEFDFGAQYESVPDSKLPFDVIPEHMRKSHGNTCMPNRKWRYHYVDGIFSNGTHYIIKSGDQDEFDIESLYPMGFLYAHGDTRTFRRLRGNIQQGKPIVMLHNSGGVVTPFSWLQRVMAFTRPPPDAGRLRGPLKFLIANLSKANWVHDFGVPEVMMMRSLAERAPQLFRKNVVSVDILTDTEEQTLEVITGCFATTGGVPELGLGNAEVNVVFNAWNLHMILCENARELWRYSVIVQLILWLLAIATTTLAVLITWLPGVLPADASAAAPAAAERRHLLRITSLEGEVHRLRELQSGFGPLGNPACWPSPPPSPYPPPSLPPYPPPLPPTPVAPSEIVAILEWVALMLPIAAALLSTIAAKMLWRDKWSVCTMAATQLVREIYMFRMATIHYDMSKPPPPPPDGEEPPPPPSAKQKAQMARQLFVDRVSTLYGSCMTEMSQGNALKRTHKKVGPQQLQAHRTATENKPTLAEWFHIKRHVEKHYYKAEWVLPSGNFLSWISGLRPYLQQRTFKEELTSVIEGLVARRKIRLKGKPLSDKASKLIRQGVAAKLGLHRSMLDAQKDEIRALQREINAALYKEQTEDRIAEEEERARAMEQAAADAAADVENGGAAATPHPPSRGGGTPGSGMSARFAGSSAQVRPAPPHAGGAAGASANEDEETFTDAGEAMRKQIMELQGLKYGKLTPKEKKEEKKKKKSASGAASKEIEDDYLAGALSCESYVIFRVRPLIENYEKKVQTLAFRLQVLDILGFILNSTGTVLVAVGQTAWVSVTVALVAVLNGVTEFTQLRNQVVSVNLALNELHKLMVKWDSLSLVTRRTRAVKELVVDTTETMILDVVNAHTTAASNTQTSVEKNMSNDNDDEEEG